MVWPESMLATDANRDCLNCLNAVSMAIVQIRIGNTSFSGVLALLPLSAVSYHHHHKLRHPRS